MRVVGQKKLEGGRQTPPPSLFRVKDTVVIRTGNAMQCNAVQSNSHFNSANKTISIYQIYDHGICSIMMSLKQIDLLTKIYFSLVYNEVHTSSSALGYYINHGKVKS